MQNIKLFDTDEKDIKIGIDLDSILAFYLEDFSNSNGTNWSCYGKELVVLVGNKISEPNKIKAPYSTRTVSLGSYNSSIDLSDKKFGYGKDIYDFLINHFAPKDGVELKFDESGKLVKK